MRDDARARRGSTLDASSRMSGSRAVSAGAGAKTASASASAGGKVASASATGAERNLSSGATVAVIGLALGAIGFVAQKMRAGHSVESVEERASETDSIADSKRELELVECSLNDSARSLKAAESKADAANMALEVESDTSSAGSEVSPEVSSNASPEVSPPKSPVELPRSSVDQTEARPSLSMRPALKLEVDTGASRGATIVASLGVDEFTIGRGRMNRFVVESAEVSTVHAKVRWNGSAWMIRDLGSLNGTRLNGVNISAGERAPGPWESISQGDVIKLGERDGSPHVSVHFFRDACVEEQSALHLRTVVRAEGAKATKTEDRVLVECPLRGNPSVGVFGVFDGHGGFEASERARQLFPEVLARRLAGRVPGPEGVKELLEQAFIESDETMAVEYEGCTASVVLVWKDAHTGALMLQAANVGDSSVAIGQAPAPSGEDHGARYLTPEHKVRHEEERDRLNAAGADLPPEATRLYGLALSRALGDKFLKDQNVGLIAHPFVSEVIRIEPKSQQHVLTIASDGIWDVLTPADVYNVMQEGDSCTHAASQSLILNARRRRSVDDISLVIVRLAVDEPVA